jgi:hypothetical protein
VLSVAANDILRRAAGGQSGSRLDESSGFLRHHLGVLSMRAVSKRSSGQAHRNDALSLNGQHRGIE